MTELRGRQTPGQETGRTQRDLPMKLILALLIATLLTTFVFFRFGVLDNWFHSVIAILIVFVISFLFTTVAANAIAIVGTNPVSGHDADDADSELAGARQRRPDRKRRNGPPR